MVISHSRRFIYWKPHKVASTSVMYALSKLCNENDSCGGIAGHVEEKTENYRRNMQAFAHLQTMGNHATPSEIKDICEILWGSELWDRYYKFTVVRNPWDWALSLLDYSQNQLGATLSFTDVIERSQRRYWFSEDGKPLADFYLHYESLEDDFATVCRTIGAPETPLPHLRIGQRDKSKPYWEHYSDANRALIERAFEMEIDYFGYRFGE